MQLKTLLEDEAPRVVVLCGREPEDVTGASDVLCSPVDTERLVDLVT